MSVVLLIGAITLALDFLTKLLVQLKMEPDQSKPIIQGIFHLTFVQNPGAAFGLMKYQTGLFIVITVVVILIIVVYSRKLGKGDNLFRVALGLQLGGAVGNLADRVRFGYVVDFLDFRVWPVFNLADTAIVVGVVLFAYELLRRGDREVV